MRCLSTFVASLLLMQGAMAADERFDEEAFREAQRSGELVLVEIFASWCPTCAKQGEILESYFAEHPDSSLEVMKVDYDEEKEWVNHFRAPGQSTLILFRGEERIWFSVRETRKEVIFEVLSEAESGAEA